MTVEELIEILKQCPEKAIVVVETYKRIGRVKVKMNIVNDFDFGEYGSEKINTSVAIDPKTNFPTAIFNEVVLSLEDK